MKIQILGHALNYLPYRLIATLENSYFSLSLTNVNPCIISVIRPCLERNGLIMMWYHADEESPSWQPPEIDEVENGDWVYQGRNEFYVNCHIQVQN